MQQPPEHSGYPQQPYPYTTYGAQPQQVQQPQPRKKRGCLITGIVIAVVLVIIVIATAANGRGGGGTTNTGQGGSSSATNQEGVPAQVGSWQVTLNGVKTSPGGQVIKPQKAGDVFLEVDVTVVNQTGSSQSLSSLIQFSLKDIGGQGYTETIDPNAPKPPDGTIANNSIIRGTLVYEVPATDHQFELGFSPALGSTDQGVWDFSV